MQFSEQWLREWVNPKLDSNQLVEKLTMAGLEVDAVEPAAPEFSKVLVGEVIACEQHPDADKLKVCTVEAGFDAPLTIVCGGVNVRQGLKVAVSVVGATLPGDFKIKKSKLRGVVSEGMICAASELGVGVDGEGKGILELDQDAPIGMDFREYWQLDDHCIDVDLTPNRGDCASIRGIARDIAALTGTERTPVPLNEQAPTIDDKFSVELAASSACPRYVGRVIKGINPKATSPVWLVEKLRRSGIRRIHPVVDIGNYVMLELGQPMHAFDMAKLSGGITVRYANLGETIQVLDGSELTLSDTDLVIADHQRPVALAGIMGGLDSGVSDDTTDVFLESAFFEPVSIAKTARRLKLHSDSAYRYERGVDFNLQIMAIERFSELLLEVAGGQVGPLVHALDEAELPTRATIDLRPERIERILGTHFDDAQVPHILTALDMQVTETDQGWQVVAPSHRFDISLEIDLIEELARLRGFDSIPSTNPVIDMQPLKLNEATIDEDTIRQFWVDQGCHETLTYSFVDPKIETLLSGNDHPRALLNPISSEMSVMRSTIWSGLIQALKYNQGHQQSRIRLFEMGLCFSDANSELEQTKKIAVLLTGYEKPEQWAEQPRNSDFYDLKGLVEQCFTLNQQPTQFSFVKGEHVALHPGKSAAIVANEQIVGFIGECHPQIAQKLNLKQKVYLFEMDLKALQNSAIPHYQPISKFPSMRRDLAVVVDESVQVADLKAIILEHGGQLLQNMHLFDVYRGEGIESGKKSIAMALEFQHADRTLVDDEVNQIFNQVVSVLKDQLSAQLRV